MAKNKEITVEIPSEIVVKNKDWKITISIGDEKKGTLLLSRGTLDWVAKNNSKDKAVKIDWEKFVDWLDSHKVVIDK